MKRFANLPRWTCVSGVFCLLGFLAVFVTACGIRNLEERRGETVLFRHTKEIRGFDPVKSGDISSAAAVSQMYEGLLQYSYLARPYRVEPALAESMPAISADGLTYTFKVRKGIFFQDDPCFTASAGKGRELVADDFVYSIKRVADPANESMGYWAFSDRIAGLDEFREAAGNSKPADYNRDVEGLKAIDRYTLQIRLKKKYPQLLWILTMNYAFAVPREAVECYGREFINHPVGTGPFMLGSWKRDYAVEYVRNPKWKEKGRKEYYPSEGEPADREKGLLDDAGREIPFLDRVVQYVIKDETTKWLKFMMGDLELSEITRDNWDAAVTGRGELTDDLVRKGIRLISIPNLDVYYIAFNMDDPVVGKNRKLRQALTCAFNSAEWERYFGGRVVRARGPIPSAMPGFENKPSANPFDLDKARKLLAEAGYPGGIDPATGKNLQLVLDLASAETSLRESTELIIDFMGKIGVMLKPSYNSLPAFLAKIERRQCQMFRLMWASDYPDAANNLQLFYSPNSSPGPNRCNYVNREFDALFEQAGVMFDCPQRTNLYRKMENMVMDDCPWIFLHNDMSYEFCHHWLKNFKPHDFPYGMTKYIRVDSEERRQWKAREGSNN